MPYALPYIPRFAHPSQHPVDPRSLELYDPNKLRPEVLQNPEYWPDNTTTHIFPEERNPSRRSGVQGISAEQLVRMLGLGDRLLGRGYR